MVHEHNTQAFLIINKKKMLYSEIHWKLGLLAIENSNQSTENNQIFATRNTSNLFA